MNTKHSKNQEFVPRFLTKKEVGNPLSTLAFFFDADSLSGHLAELKIWRHHVLSDEYFKGRKDSPSALLFAHKLTGSIVEALYLFLQHELDKPVASVGKLFEENGISEIGREQNSWKEYPQGLTTEELVNPYLVLKNVFALYSPAQYSSMLYEWLEYGLSSKAAAEGIETIDLINTYESIQKMYAVAWLLFKRASNTNFTAKCNEEKSFLTEETILEEIKQVVFKRFPSVQIVNHLGTHLSSITFFIIFIVDDSEKLYESELSNKIEDHCRYIATVHAFVHRIINVKNAVNEGNRFWNTSLKNGKILYKNPTLTMPIYVDINRQALINEANLNWDRWAKQGAGFLKGAEFYSINDEHTLTLYLTHQAIEFTLKAFIQTFVGYGVQMHNIPRLLRITLLTTDSINEVFKLNTDEGKKALELLHSATVLVRYYTYSTPDTDLVKFNLKTAQTLLPLCNRLFENYLAQLNAVN